MGSGKIYQFILDCGKSRMDAISTLETQRVKEHTTNKLAANMGKRSSVIPKQDNKEESEKNVNRK